MRITSKMKSHLDSLKCQGDFIEIGIFRGDTSKELIPIAMNQTRVYRGVDSFEGMDTPTEHDHTGGKCAYPKGRLSCGYANVIRNIGNAGKEGTDFFLYKGFVPAVFMDLPESKYAFVYMDLDHYQPTVEAIDYIWSEISEGGLLLFDDYLPVSDKMATRAIKEFLVSTIKYEVVESEVLMISGGCESQLLLRKI